MEFKYELVDKVATLSDPSKPSSWTKEVNVIIWGKSKSPMIDIRKWNRDEETGEVKMSKGISLSLEEFKLLQKINTKNLERYFQE